jgi:hypothetical protein
MEIHGFNGGTKDTETTPKQRQSNAKATKPMQSTLALSRHGWLNTVYEIKPHASTGSEIA